MDLHKLPRLQKVLLLDKISKGEMSIKKLLGNNTQIFFYMNGKEGVFYSNNDLTNVANPKNSRHDTIIFLPANNR